MPLIQHPFGNYCFLPGIAPYSCGVVANPGFEIVHVTFQNPIVVALGFQAIDRFLSSKGRPRAALCAIELRSPKPFSFPGFAAFNAGYTTVLDQWGLFVEGANPVARTNVAPVVRPPDQPVIYGFSYTQPSASQVTTFVVAGAGELPEGVLAREGIVALGDISDEGLKIKSRFVMNLMESRLFGLGANWSLVSTLDLYTAHSVTPLLPEIILGRIGNASIHGAVWHYSRPPIEEIEYEMDMRGTATDLRIADGPSGHEPV